MSCIALKSKAGRQTGAILILPAGDCPVCASEFMSKGDRQIMPKATSKPGHVTRGEVFDDLGFTPAEASVLKIKAKILSALLEKIKRQRLTQAQLVRVLDDYQPNISILLNGKISKMSIEKLLYYAHRLRLHADIRMKPESEPKRKVRVA